jgi:hypothetical protein
MIVDGFNENSDIKFVGTFHHQNYLVPGGRVFLSYAGGSAKGGLLLYSLPAPGTGLAMCKAALTKKGMGKGIQAIAVLVRISV